MNPPSSVLRPPSFTGCLLQPTASPHAVSVTRVTQIVVGASSVLRGVVGWGKGGRTVGEGEKVPSTVPYR